MAWPKATDFLEAVQDLRGSVDDEELRGGEVARTPLGLPVLWSGNFADVFKIHCPATGNAWALKCFTRQVPGLQTRYRRIAAHLGQAQLPFTVDFQYLPEGIRIGQGRFPALKMRWVEGLTLNQFVEEHLQRPGNLKMLLDLWLKLSARLRQSGIAHADLQHGNVLLVPQDHGALALRLIDYDGMYVPALADSPSGELGHPAYQHPQRLREGTYNAEVDRFPHLAIYTAIRCLMVGRGQLWQRFNNGDNLLFREADFKQPATSDLFGALWELRDADVRALAGRLILACGRPLDQTPLLDEILVNGKVLPLSWKEESRVAETLALGKAAAAPVPPLPPGEGQGVREADPRQSTPKGRTVELPGEGRGEGGAAVSVALPPPVSPGRAAGKWLWRGPATAGRTFDTLLRRLVGEDNDLLRYFLWATLPLLLLAAIWAGIAAFTPPPPPWKLHPIAPQTAEAGNELTVAVTVDNGDAGRVKWRYGVVEPKPPGMVLDPQTGRLTWTPTTEQARGDKQIISVGTPDAMPRYVKEYQVTVFAATPDRRDETALVVSVTAPLPLKLKPIDTKTVNVGGSIGLTVGLENAEAWKGKVRYSLASPTPPGMSIDAATGIVTWTPAEGQAADKHKLTVLATGPHGRRDETSFVVNVLRLPAPLRFQPISPQTVEAGKPLSVTATVENSAAWEGKLRYRLGPESPAGATVNTEMGELTWTPPPDQPAGKYNMTVLAQGPDGQTARTTLVVTVTRPPPPKEIAVDLGDGVKLEMVLIPAGEFLMGSPDSENGRSADEGPQHKVRITKPFYLGKYLVTQEQWENVMGSNPSQFKGPKKPVETVSWQDCQGFIRKLNARFPHPGPLPEGEGVFRLPTEAQWEYACRAGSTTRFCFGDDESELGDYAWYSANSNGKAHPVGEKKPNAWGLYDMHGNVWEWCEDWYDGGYYAKSPTDDPTGSGGGALRVFRGGCWFHPAGSCRSASRYRFTPRFRGLILGLRVSRVLADK